MIRSFSDFLYDVWKEDEFLYFLILLLGSLFFPCLVFITIMAVVNLGWIMLIPIVILICLIIITFFPDRKEEKE